MSQKQDGENMKFAKNKQRQRGKNKVNLEITLF